MTEDTQLFSKPYLGDSRLDRMMGVIFALSGEVAVLKADIARLTNKTVDEAKIETEMQAFAREILKPLTDPDFDVAPRQIR
jgi:hypothetical protein